MASDKSVVPAIRELHVTPENFGDLKDWSLLPESEFLANVYQRYGLRASYPGEVIRVVIDWRPRYRRVFDNWPDGSIVKPDKPPTPRKEFYD